MVEHLILSEDITRNLPPLKNFILDFIPEDEHLELGGYEPAAGLRRRSKHWRKSKDRGCFHITIKKNGNARIHWDAWDPRRHPLRHFCEIIYRFFLLKLYLKIRKPKALPCDD